MNKFIVVLTVAALSAPVLATSFPGEERPDPLSPVRAYTTYDWETDAEYEYTVDDSAATFRITVPEKEVEEVYDEADAKEAKLYSNFVDAAGGCDYWVLPSLELCGIRGKFFDDGMYAAIELELEKGTAELRGGKDAFLLRFAEVLNDKYKASLKPADSPYRSALVYVVAGLVLGSADGSVPDGLDVEPFILEEARAEAAAFVDEDPLRSKPIGFYTWRPELGRIFTRDRWLQRKFKSDDDDEFRVALALTDAVASYGDLRAQHEYVVNTYARLTNPLASETVGDYVSAVPAPAKALVNAAAFDAAKEALAGEGRTFALFPASRSKEVDLCNKLQGFPLLGGNLMDVLIEEIQAGRMTLKPDRSSGWYEYQQYALEALLTPDKLPEGKKLIMDERYRERLEEAFRSMLTQARETHIKSLDIAEAGAEPELEVYVSPEFNAEPIPTYYLRVARGYGFLRGVLETALGERLLKTYGLREEGAAADVLDAELAAIQELYYGLYLETCANIGLVPDLEAGEVEDPAGAARAAEAWLGDWKGDPLMSQDIRVIVPIGPTGDGRLDCWAVLGVRPINIVVSYEEKPVVSTDAPVELIVNYLSRDYSVLVPVFAEVILPTEEPLTRDEFRAVCDAYDNKDDIVEALESGAGGTGPSLGPGGTTKIIIIAAAALCLIVAVALVGFVIFLVLSRRKKRK
ncbi:MAG: hypothetical protein JSW52_12460 [Candidatus Coatesbacteria bacterium]|nr:MAG: hypothetical protein JSW52_12460 [Candidatus Coatesbacteria bacterium]